MRVLKKSTRFGPEELGWLNREDAKNTKEELGRGREEVSILRDVSGANPKIFAAVADFAFTNDWEML